MSSRRRSRHSLCERSMEVVANLIRLSSFSVARMSLGIAGRPASFGSLSSARDSLAMADEPELTRISGSRRLQEPQSRSMPISYLVEPEEGIESAYVICDDNNVDGKASAYIDKIRKKHQNSLREAFENAPIISPPPPPPRTRTLK